MNIFNLKLKASNSEKELNPVNRKGNLSGTIKHYPPATNEWRNSIYVFNKNSSKLFTIADNTIINLIRSYFNMYNRYLERKNKDSIRHLRSWKRRLQNRKIWISSPELKHTNDRVIINLYIYNRQKEFFSHKIINLFNWFNKIIEKEIYNKLINNNKEYLKKIEKRSVNIFKGLKLKTKFKDLKIILLKNIIKKSFKKEIFFMHYTQSAFLNRFKFNSTYILPLNMLLTKIYRKKVIFNLVKLKNFFLNSDILTQLLDHKIRNRNNAILNVMDSSLIQIKPPVLKSKWIRRMSNPKIGLQNILIQPDMNKNIDVLNEMLINNIDTKKRDSILNNIKGKTIIGVRIEASGRLTKRITAARSMSKLRYAGTLKHIDSSYRGRSAVILRGNLRSNTQFTNINSVTRLGSFGVKGWVNSK